MLPNLALTYRFIVAYPALQSCYKVYKCLSQRRWPRAKTSTPFQKTNEYLTINLFIVRPNYNLVYSAYYKLVYSGLTITLFIVRSYYNLVYSGGLVSGLLSKARVVATLSMGWQTAERPLITLKPSQTPFISKPPDFSRLATAAWVFGSGQKRPRTLMNGS